MHMCVYEYVYIYVFGFLLINEGNYCYIHIKNYHRNVYINVFDVVN